MHMSATNKAIVAKVNAAFAEGSTEGFLSFCAEDVAWTMVGDTTVKGKDAIRQWMASMGPMEPPKFTVHNIIAEGDCVRAYCDIYRLRGDKIVALSAFVIQTEAKY